MRLALRKTWINQHKNGVMVRFPHLFWPDRQSFSFSNSSRAHSRNTMEKEVWTLKFYQYPHWWNTEPVEIDEICLHARIGVHFLYFPYKAFIKKPEILAEVVLESFEELNNSKNRNRKIECQDVENSSGELLAETSERDTSCQSSDECICPRNVSTPYNTHRT